MVGGTAARKRQPMDATTLLLSTIFGAVGLGYFIYGKRQGHAVAMIAGLLLMVVPYLLPDPILTSLASLALMAAPFLADRMGW
jgi:hypothetical protein